MSHGLNESLKRWSVWMHLHRTFTTKRLEPLLGCFVHMCVYLHLAGVYLCTGGTGGRGWGVGYIVLTANSNVTSASQRASGGGERWLIMCAAHSQGI